MSKYIFYPGCSLEGTAAPYYDSIKAIKDKLDVEIEEIKDWNCCGATEYQAVERLAGHAVVGRNLAIAQSQANGSNTLTAPCSACYLNLTKTDHYMAEDVKFSETVNDQHGFVLHALIGNRIRYLWFTAVMDDISNLLFQLLAGHYSDKGLCLFIVADYYPPTSCIGKSDHFNGHFIARRKLPFDFQGFTFDYLSPIHKNRL